MTLWTPDWRIKVNGSELTSVTLSNLTITSGRQDINSPTPAGYCSVEVINTDGTNYSFTINTAVTIEIKDTSGNYVSLFGGRVSDLRQIVRSAGSSAVITSLRITAIGALSRLQRAIFDGNLAEGLDGAQILDLLDDLLLGSWNEVPPAETWATYDATETWADAQNIGLGEIDAGEYTMVSRQITDSIIGPIANQIANSALGYLYEDANGLIGYADASHRQDYLVANGYTNLDASYATPSSIRSTTQTNRIRNSLIYRYSTGYASTYSASDSASITSFGLYERSYESNIKNSTDIDDIAARELSLRATPRGSLETITFRLDNPDMPSVLLDRLINVFFGQPVLIQNLPSNMLDGSFGGFVENVVMNATPTYVDLTLYVSATPFSLSLLQWQTITPTTLTWAGVNGTLTWTNAIGALT